MASNRVRAERTHAVAVELEKLDPRLQLIPPSRVDEQVEGMVPGYWHVVRLSDQGEAIYHVVDDPETGEPIEPDSGLVERFRAMNTWDRRAEEDRAKERARVLRARQHAAEQLRGEIRDDLYLNAKAMMAPGIRFGGSWAAKHGQRHKASKGGVILP